MTTRRQFIQTIPAAGAARAAVAGFASVLDAGEQHLVQEAK